MLGGVNVTQRSTDGVIGPTSLIAQALCGIVLTGGANGEGSVSVNIHDGTGTSGTLLFTVKCLAETTEAVMFDFPIGITTGQIYANLTGTNAVVSVLWK